MNVSVQQVIDTLLAHSEEEEEVSEQGDNNC